MWVGLGCCFANVSPRFPSPHLAPLTHPILPIKQSCSPFRAEINFFHVRINVTRHESVNVDTDLEKSFDDPNYVIDPVAERKLLRKMDLHIVPPLFVLFLMVFLDRVNIGNAKIQGLTTDLHMKGQQYNIALFIFFIPYVSCYFLLNRFYSCKNIRMKSFI